jgi:hypothetical protein
MMNPEHAKEIQRMSAALRALVEAELQAGNEIIEIGHSFPAAPVGCYVMLAKPVSSRPRASSAGISFYDRKHPNYSGEFADDQRHFSVLEPPHPPEPDMDAIRAQDTAVARFMRSMEIDYGKWHDGVGYDIDVIRQAKPDERAEIEELLLSRPIADWRDVEALAAIDSPGTRAALEKTFRHGNHELRSAVIDHAPQLVSDDRRAASLVAALKSADIYGGLSRTLDQVEDFHPPEVIDALFRGLLERDGEAAVHFAAMLMFLHGKASEAFDWDQRPFFLQFHATDSAERRRLFRELCDKIGVDADTTLKRLNV